MWSWMIYGVLVIYVWQQIVTTVVKQSSSSIPRSIEDVLKKVLLFLWFINFFENLQSLLGIISQQWPSESQTNDPIFDPRPINKHVVQKTTETASVVNEVWKSFVSGIGADAYVVGAIQ